MPSIRSGALVLGIGGVHLLVGLAGWWQPLRDMVGAGLLDSLHDGAGARLVDREAAFWFEVSGTGLVLLGGLALWAERRVGVLPTALGWGLVGLATAGVVVAPVSGFWSLFVPGALVLVRARRARALASVPA